MYMSIRAGIRRYVYSVLAAEISNVTKYADRVIQWIPTPNDDFTLLEMIDNQHKTVSHDNSFSDISCERDRKTIILINGSTNHNYDIQGLLLKLLPHISST